MPHDARAKPAWPLFRSLASYSLPGDLMAGLTLAAIAIPEQMATARLGGFAPQIGFFAFMAGVPGLLVVRPQPLLFSGGRFPITPTLSPGPGGAGAAAAPPDSG